MLFSSARVLSLSLSPSPLPLSSHELAALKSLLLCSSQCTFPLEKAKRHTRTLSFPPPSSFKICAPLPLSSPSTAHRSASPTRQDRRTAMPAGAVALSSTITKGNCGRSEARQRGRILSHPLHSPSLRFFSATLRSSAARCPAVALRKRRTARSVCEENERGLQNLESHGTGPRRENLPLLPPPDDAPPPPQPAARSLRHPVTPHVMYSTAQRIAR